MKTAIYILFGVLLLVLIFLLFGVALTVFEDTYVGRAISDKIIEILDRERQ